LLFDRSVVLTYYLPTPSYGASVSNTYPLFS
jgi:hypothetical protein